MKNLGTHSPKGPTGHLALLDHLRGLAILAVMLFHSLSTVFGYDVLPWRGCWRSTNVPDEFWYFLPISFLNIGVPIFFVVSGFCIHLSHEQQGKNWGSFFIRRIFRICPAYFAALIFFLLFFAHHLRLDIFDREIWRQFLTHAFFVHNLQTTTIGAVNGSFWSMAVEVQLYLIYPALLWLVKKWNWRGALTILAVIECLIRAADGLAESMGLAQTSFGHFSWLLFVSPFGFWFSWAIGAALADAYLKRKPMPFSKIPIAGCLFLAMICYAARPLDDFRFTLFSLMTATLIARRLNSAAPKSTPSREPFWGDTLKALGLWSYSLYLLHQPLLNVYSYAINSIVPAESRPAPVAFALVLTCWAIVIPFGYLWYRTFELPGIAWGKRIIQKISLARSGIVAGNERRGTNHFHWTIALGIFLFFTGSLWAGLRLLPVEPVANNNLAWSLATNPDAGKRNGPRAVELAEDACRQTHYETPVMIGTLAAAYAEAGRYEEAISAALQACALAEQKGETNLLEKNRELLMLYQNRKAYRETSAAPASAKY